MSIVPLLAWRGVVRDDNDLRLPIRLQDRGAIVEKGELLIQQVVLTQAAEWGATSDTSHVAGKHIRAGNRGN